MFKQTIRSLTRACLLFPFIFLMSNCKKENQITMDPLPDLDRQFNEKNLGKNLLDSHNDSTDLYWEPDWSNPARTVSNSITYAYVPLKPKLVFKNGTGSTIKVKTTGVTKFIIAQIEADSKLSFLVATYISENSSLEGSNLQGKKILEFFQNFSGKVLLKDLQTDKSYVTIYKNGTPADDKSQAKIMAGSGWYDWECTEHFICQWGTFCTNTVWITIKEGTSCSFPPIDYPFGCNGYTGIWTLYQTTVTLKCKLIEYPLPPLPVPPEYPPSPNNPCPGDMIVNPHIARSSITNIRGGRFGPDTRSYRSGAPKAHWGTDIFAIPNTPVVSMYSGTVVRIEGSKLPDFYAESGTEAWGNFVEIETTLPSGQIIRVLYAHLNSTNVSNGQPVGVGTMIGQSGKTGNANEGFSPHVHIQVKDMATHQLLDPELYIATKFDATTGYPINPPCL